MSANDRTAYRAPGEGAFTADQPPSLFEHLAVVWRHRRLLAGCVLSAGVMAAGVALLLPNEYAATARLLPRRGQGSGLDLVLGESATAAGLAQAAFGLESKDKLYVGFLKTRRILGSVARRFDLQSVYEAEDIDETLAALQEATRFEISKEDLLVITVIDRDPARAAAMANAFVEELQELTQGLDFGKAGKERRFLESQIDTCRERLARAEESFKQFKEEHRAVELEAQAKASIESLAELYGKLKAEQVHYEQLTLSRKDQDPLVLQSLAAQRELKEQIDALESGPDLTSVVGSRPAGAGAKNVSALIPVGAMPELALQFERYYRDVKVEEALFEMLSQQVMLARIREQRDSMAVQVVEEAVAPTRKTRPKRTFMVLAGSCLGGFFGLIAVFFFEGLSRYRRRAPAPSVGVEPRCHEEPARGGAPPVIVSGQGVETRDGVDFACGASLDEESR